VAGRVVPKQGESWNVTFDPVEGHEQDGSKPVLIVSTDRFNQNPIELCVVMPLTSTVRGLAINVPIIPPEGGVNAPSVVLTNQLRTISQNRLGRKLGTVEPPTLAQAFAIMRRFFGI
jgi:mRNA interferase MazF